MKVSNFHLTWEISEDFVDLMQGNNSLIVFPDGHHDELKMMINYIN